METASCTFLIFFQLKETLYDHRLHTFYRDLFIYMLHSQSLKKTYKKSSYQSHKYFKLLKLYKLFLT